MVDPRHPGPLQVSGPNASKNTPYGSVPTMSCQAAVLTYSNIFIFNQVPSAEAVHIPQHCARTSACPHPLRSTALARCP